MEMQAYTAVGVAIDHKVLKRIGYWSLSASSQARAYQLACSALAQCSVLEPGLFKARLFASSGLEFRSIAGEACASALTAEA